MPDLHFVIDRWQFNTLPLRGFGIDCGTLEIRTLKKTAALAQRERIEESAVVKKASGRAATGSSEVLENNADDRACLICII